MYGDPASVAAQFGVEQNDNGAILVDRADPDNTFKVRRYGVYTGIVGTPATVGHTVLPDHGPWVFLRVDEVRDCTAFVIDSTGLHHVELDEIRIVTVDDFQRRHQAKVAEEGDDSEPQDEEQPAEKEIPASLGHLTGESLEYGPWEWFGLTVGLPEPHLTELIKSCLAGRKRRVFLGGYVRAYTASYFYNDRPLILLANQDAVFDIDEVTFTDPLQSSATTETVVNEADQASIDDTLGHNVQTPQVVEGKRSTRRGGILLGTTAAVCLLIALVGGGPALVLAIAVLGAAGALLTVLSSL